MTLVQLDHLTFVCKSLEQAQAYAAKHFGVELPPGGEHPLMGTHNLLTRISERVFLEFIAINPTMQPIQRARWFALDRLTQSGALDHEPKLLGWVASVDGRLSLLRNTHPNLVPQVLQLSRGELKWLMAIRDDGEVEHEGAFPTLIDWGDAGTPVGKMKSVGIELVSLQIRCVDLGIVKNRLRALGWDDDLGTNAYVRWTSSADSFLKLTLATPNGLVSISGGAL
jgi:hypothetical protein